jgi:hypothetical protein
MKGMGQTWSTIESYKGSSLPASSIIARGFCDLEFRKGKKFMSTITERTERESTRVGMNVGKKGENAKG